MHVLPRQAENLAELARRGAPTEARSRWVGVRCVSCGHDYLFDENANVMLLDPRCPKHAWDLDRDAPVACRGCGHTDWEFEDVHPDDESFAEGPWSFAFWSPPAPRSRGPLAKAAAYTALGLLATASAVAVAFNPDPFAPPGHARPSLDLYK